MLDIIDVGVGVGGGANVEIGKFSIGAGAGLGNLAMQGGEFGSRGKTWEGILLPYQKYVIFNSNREAQERIMFRRKIYIVNSMMMDDRSDMEFYPPTSKAHYTRIGVSGGFPLIASFHFNIGELADFLLGFVGIDIYDDDFYTTKEKLQKDYSNE